MCSGGLVGVREDCVQGAGDAGLCQVCSIRMGFAFAACPQVNVGVTCCRLRKTLKRFRKE